MLTSTIHNVHDPQYPYPRYPQVCDHDPQYLYPQYPQSTMSMTHNILINDIYDPRCHCPWSTMSFIILWTTFLNRYPHQQPQLKRTNQSKDAWDRRGKWFIIIYCCWSLMGRSLLLLAGRARKAEMVWKSLERGTGPVQPVLPRKPRPLRPLGLLPLPQGRWSS